MSTSLATLHPRTRQYALAAAEEGLLARRDWFDAFGDLECVLSRAALTGEFTDRESEITPELFEYLWVRQRDVLRSAFHVPLSVAAMAVLPLHTAKRASVHVTVVYDVPTGCVTGFAAHRKRVDPAAEVRALDRAVAIKHNSARRLPGCVHSWPCFGIPEILEISTAPRDRPGELYERCGLLGIVDGLPETNVDWDLIQTALAAAVSVDPMAATLHKISEIERTLTVAVVDGINQRRLSDGSTPHRRWIASLGAYPGL